MYEILKNKQDKIKPLMLFGFIAVSLLLLTVVYKSDDKIIKKSQKSKDVYEISDFKTFKQFIVGQIKSPFVNIVYEIKRGDTIQKILQKNKINNREIQKIINEYKKFGNSNQLIDGNNIDIIIKKN